MFLPLLIKDAQSWGVGNPRLVLISGPAAVSSNPTRIGKGQFSLYASHCFWFLGMRKDQLALSQNIGIIDFGLSLEYFDYGDLEQYPEYPSGEPIGNFPAFDFFFTPGFSLKVPSGRLGLNVSYLYELIFDESYSSYCLDLVLDYNPITRMDILIGLCDFNPGIRQDTNRYYPPVSITGGIDYAIGSLVFGGELSYLIHSDDFTASGGVEYTYRRVLSIRIGVFCLDKVTPTVGLGYHYHGLTIDLGFAQHPYGLGISKHIGIGFNF